MQRPLIASVRGSIRATRAALLAFGGLSLASCAALASPAVELAAHHHTRDFSGRTGLSAIWLWANISYAGMRAQNSASTAWRVVAFIFGFPGTLLTFLVVPEGSERAYGVELPKRSVPGA